MLESLIRILLPFFTWTQLALFHRMQQLSGLLISGSAALSFFTDEDYPGSDLDLYVEFERRSIVFEYLAKAGYRYMPRSGQPDSLSFLQNTRGIVTRTRTTSVLFGSTGYDGRSIVAVLNFGRRDSNRVIQIVLTRGTPVRCILEFHSTLVMNFISATHAVSLYPIATFLNRTSAMAQRMVGHQSTNLTVHKYRSRGFKYLDDGPQYRELFYPGICRRIGDGYSWVVCLEESESQDELANPMMSNTWRLLDATGEGGFWIDYGLMQSVNMDETYCIATTLVPLILPEGERWDDETVYETMSTVIYHHR